MVLDYERAFLELEHYVRSRTSHGEKDLLAKMVDIRHNCMVDEGLPEKALRLYGTDLIDAVSRSGSESTPADRGPASDRGHGEEITQSS